MDIVTILILTLIVVGAMMITIQLLKSETKCPEQNVIYRYIPKHTLDVQFGEENKPSVIYKDMFTEGPPWIGGYDLGIGKTNRIKV